MDAAWRRTELRDLAREAAVRTAVNRSGSTRGLKNIVLVSIRLSVITNLCRATGNVLLNSKRGRT